MKEDKLAKALSLIRIKGPIIPSQINKDLEVDVLMGSAILSELVDKGQLKLSRVKIGGSPLYYIPGQESRLQQFSSYLNGKDLETYELLRQKKVLRDRSLETLRRVSLRQIKDFARPLNVRVGNEDIIFWKWYLLSNEEAGNIIKTMLPKVEQEKPRVESEPQKVQAPKREDIPVQKEIEKKIEPTQVEKPIEKKVEKPVEKKPISNDSEKEKEITHERQERLAEQKQESEIEIPKDRFFRKVKKYFDDNGISITDYKINRKESDIEFTVKISSSVGSLNYFCKAKNKKKFNDGDISSVFIEGQRKKMPVLFLITGDLTKKAKDVLEKEFENMYVKKI